MAELGAARAVGRLLTAGVPPRFRESLGLFEQGAKSEPILLRLRLFAEEWLEPGDEPFGRWVEQCRVVIQGGHFRERREFGSSQHGVLLSFGGEPIRRDRGFNLRSVELDRLETGSLSPVNIDGPVVKGARP